MYDPGVNATITATTRPHVRIGFAGFWDDFDPRSFLSAHDCGSRATSAMLDELVARRRGIARPLRLDRLPDAVRSIRNRLRRKYRQWTAIRAATAVATRRTDRGLAKRMHACILLGRFLRRWLMTLTIDVELPNDLEKCRLPAAVQQRLDRLLDQQDSGLALSDDERSEAEGLVDLAEFLTLLRMRAERLAK